MASTRSLDLRSVTSILAELKSLSTSALIAGIDSIVKAKLAKQSHSSALLIHQLKRFVGFAWRSSGPSTLDARGVTISMDLV